MNFDFQDNEKPLEVRVSNLVSQLTIDEKISLLSTKQSPIERLHVPEYRVGGEAAHGVVDREGMFTTVFPQPIGLSSTWNKDLLQKVGEAIGDEARGYYYYKNKKTGLTLWAPTIDMERDPRWGRTEEAYGEDPHLTGQLSKHLIMGMQGDHPFYLKMVAAPKHFYGNNNEHGRESLSNSIDARNRFEYYLPAFEPAFTEAKATSMMTAYNGINGIPGMQLNEIRQVVREQWGMDGFVVSDGGALTLNVEEYHYYDNFPEALADSLKKGIDCFVDDKELVESAAHDALKQGLITEEDITLAISRCLKVRFRLGQFDQVDPFESSNSLEQLIEQHKPLAEEVTDQSIVLLKDNKQVLPVQAESIKRIAVIGPTADQIFRDWYAGYSKDQVTILQGLKQRFNKAEFSFTNGFNQIALKNIKHNKFIKFNAGNKADLTNTKRDASIFIDEDWGYHNHLLFERKSKCYLSLTNGVDFQPVKEEVYDWFVKEKIGFYNLDANTTAKQLTSWRNKPIQFDESQGLIEADQGDEFESIVVEDGIAKAVQQAKDSDVAIVCIGNHPMLNGRETEDRLDIELAAYHQRLIKAVYRANANMILVVVGSYPFSLNWEQAHLPAIFYTAHGAQHLGHSIAKLIAGDCSPSGRLSMTWYQDTLSLPSIYDYDIIKGKRTYMYPNNRILYPFGHGLTYGEPVYSNLNVNQTQIVDDQVITVSVEVENADQQPFAEVIQLYAAFNQDAFKRPEQKLIGFEKIMLEPGAKEVVSFEVTAEQFKFFDVRTESMRLFGGVVVLSIGRSSQDLRLQTAPLTVAAQPVVPRDLSQVTKAEMYDDYADIMLGKGEDEVVCVVNKNNGHLFYNKVSLPEQGALIVRASTDGGKGEITLHLDGQVQASALEVNPESPFVWEDYRIALPNEKTVKDLTLSLKGPVAIQSLYIKEGK
ncbi:beta-glucosidase [Amphibacillus marinus]|uniref:Beta-glucosidase n=1 Tax=Amphibacillus marinus TaxID=872970 RepID=A0A1H8QER4_9BACI|nr:glycoside hydrolase family 3 C-terminal domain-containing protein [Amphibacillus marinus]SEO52546.1 beta-glucosidase [Amphibacillus marinus]